MPVVDNKHLLTTVLLLKNIFREENLNRFTMINIGIGSLAFLVFLNVTFVHGWWGCGPQNEGQGCSAFCKCRAGLTCEAFVHKCRGPGRSGDTCHATKPCGHGLSCQPGVHRCYHNPRRHGEACAAGYPCGPGLFCKPLEHVCARRRGRNERCSTGSISECIEGLRCNSHFKCSQ